MVSRVVLLRHAMPLPEADSDPAAWPLSAAGRVAADAAGSRWPAADTVVSSPERKAVETVALASGRRPAEVGIDARFGEVVRPGEPFDDDMRARRSAWVRGHLDHRHRGWETPAQAGARFDAALGELFGEVVVVGTHGMIITAWLGHREIVEPGAGAADFWESLGFPELITVDLVTRTIIDRWAPE